MEIIGIKLDLEYLSKLKTEFDKDLSEIELKIRGIDGIGEGINLRSPKQVSELLFEKLGLPVILMGHFLKLGKLDEDDDV